MIGTSIRTLILFFLTLHFVLLYSLFNLCNLFFFIFQIRIIRDNLLAFNSAFAMIRLVIPFKFGIKILSLIFFFLVSFVFNRKLQSSQIVFDHLLQSFPLNLIVFLQLFSFIQVLTCSILSYFNVVVDTLFTKFGINWLSILFDFTVKSHTVLVNSCWICLPHLVNTFAIREFIFCILHIESSILSHASTLFVTYNSCTSSSGQFCLSLSGLPLLHLFQLVKSLKISLKTLWARTVRISNVW